MKQLGGEKCSLIKYKVIELLLQININIGRKLTFLLAKYEADEYIENNEKLDLRGISNRMKNVILHDQDIIDKRLAICNSCEFLFKLTGTCKKCGCFVSKKTRVSTQSCPISKWGKEYEFIKGRNVTHATG